MDIDTARKEIDAIDTLFAELFEKRMKLARAIGEQKLKQNLPIEDKAREQQIINARCSLINSAELRPGFERVLGEMIKVSKSYQRSLVDRQEGYATEFASRMLEVDTLPCGRVGYSGIEGSYAHEAVCQIFPDSDSEGFNGFEEVLRGLGKDIEYGVLPIENSSTGGIAEVYDLLRKYGAYIVGEHTVYIEHCLLGIKGGSIRQVKKVLSHQEGIMQCRDYVAMHKLQSEAMVNTAVAAKYVSDQNDVGLCLADHLADAVEGAAGDVCKGLSLLHHIQIKIGLNIKGCKNLIQHLAVLSGNAYDALDLFPLLQFLHKRSHFDCLGTSPENAHNFNFFHKNLS